MQKVTTKWFGGLFVVLVGCGAAYDCDRQLSCDVPDASVQRTINSSRNPATKQRPCRVQSSGNILSNPGFDDSTTGWSNVTLSTDAWDCAQSNSAAIQGSGDSATTLVCVTLPGSASNYYFGGEFRGGGPLSELSMSFWSDTQCTDTMLGSPVSLRPDAPLSDWKAASRSLTVPRGAKALRVQSITLPMLMDELYVSTDDQFGFRSA